MCAQSGSVQQYPARQHFNLNLRKHIVKQVSVWCADFIDVESGKQKPTENEEGLNIAKKRVIPLEAKFYYHPFYPGPHKNCYLEPTGW